MRLETAIMICTHLIHVSRWPVACICVGLKGEPGVDWDGPVMWIWGGLGVDWGGLVLVLVSQHYRNHNICMI